MQQHVIGNVFVQRLQRFLSLLSLVYVLTFFKILFERFYTYEQK